MLSLLRCMKHYKKKVLVSILLLTVFIYFLSLLDRDRSNAILDFMPKSISSVYHHPPDISSETNLKIPSEAELRLRWIKEKVEKMSQKIKDPILDKISSMEDHIDVFDKAHIFYYAWYKTPEVDGVWKHWNLEYLAKWTSPDRPSVFDGHNPPDDIGANFYPELGPYSSRNHTVIDVHMSQIRETGLGVIVVSWYPPQFSDSSDDIFVPLLDASRKYGLKVAPHIGPSVHQNPTTFYESIKYFIRKFGTHPSLYRMNKSGNLLPVYYICDSYLTRATHWRELLTREGNLSIRGTELDGVFLGLLADVKHRYEIIKGNFDGFYTYFAANGFTYGSSWKNWKALSKFSRQSKLLFVPCVGPGYTDTAVRAWNNGNMRHRLNGHYYEAAWRAALDVRPSLIAVTSYNEWHEGTQIEPAVPKKRESFTYFDYMPNQPDFYLKLTKWWVKQYLNLIAV